MSSNNYIGIFDVIGPVMVGPSSSHTSGAATIALMSRRIFTGTPVKATFTLYGSFAETYRGHGTDRALIGGVLGYRSDDLRIRDAYDEAKKAGLTVDFIVDRETEMAHPNTIDVELESANGHKLLIRGVSVGGGRVRIIQMNDVRVDFTGEYNTMIICHKDKTGTIAHITGLFAEYKIGIVNLKLFRNKNGENAFTIIETYDTIPEELKEEVLRYENAISVDVIEP